MTDHYMTPKAALISIQLEREVGEGLYDTILHCRQQDMPYRQIAVKVSEWSGTRITHESLFSWATEWGIDDQLETVA